MEYKIVTTTKGFFTFDNIVDKDNNPIAVVVNRKAIQNLLDTNKELLEYASRLMALNRTQGVTQEEYEAAEIDLENAINKAKGE